MLWVEGKAVGGTTCFMYLWFCFVSEVRLLAMISHILSRCCLLSVTLHKLIRFDREPRNLVARNSLIAALEGNASPAAALREPTKFRDVLQTRTSRDKHGSPSADVVLNKRGFDANRAWAGARAW